MNASWTRAAARFFRSLQDPESRGARSVPGGPVTLYGTVYASLGEYYLGSLESLPERTQQFVVDCQDPEAGLMLGPELRGLQIPGDAFHDWEHLAWHLTCAAVPFCRQFGIPLRYPLRAAHKFCDAEYLRDWLDRRDLKIAWFEGNNLLFVGQLLVYLRDVEHHPAAQHALDLWFRWLDDHIDSKTSLWGTNGYCSNMEAVYGGYHQLLVYYHERHPIPNLPGLIDTTLSLQHPDGGFNPNGNGGACEDVDCVDILVNAYKRIDYRRAEIRCALRQCLHHIVELQNPDGGFPYNRNAPQSHMGIPATRARSNQSTAFASWFRVHTLALMAEILTDEPELNFSFRFTDTLSMGWHQTWDREQHALTSADRIQEKEFLGRWNRRRLWWRITWQWNPLTRLVTRAFRILRGGLRRLRGL